MTQTSQTATATPFTAADLRRELRTATAEPHGVLDRHFDAIIDPQAASTYRDFVRMNHVCHAILEPWLARQLPEEVALLRPRLTDQLDADMAALQLEPLSISQEMAAFDYQGLSSAAGVVYVLDGSRLGARMILTHWTRRKDMELQPAAYLSAAAANGQVFAAFDALAARLEPAHTEQSIAAAQAAFKLFERASALITANDR